MALHTSLVGARVVRGPHWKWEKQDGGEGGCGTIRSFNSENEVVVLWDNGTAANYRCSSYRDIALLDSASAGVKHEGVICYNCNAALFGTKWQCSECQNVHMCSTCYHADKHYVKHRFYRIVFPGSDKTLVESRRKAKKLSSRGLFPGAVVARGLDWKWANQDGGPGHKGKLLQIQDWNAHSLRSGGYVQWDAGAKNLYRLAVDGLVDVKALSYARGPSYYKDHLYPLGEPLHSTRICASQFEVGDRVSILLDPPTVEQLQRGHGGWSTAMMETLSNVGTVTGGDGDHDLVVQYSSGHTWTFNPAVLTKLEGVAAVNGTPSTAAVCVSGASISSPGGVSSKCKELLTAAEEGDVTRLNELLDELLHQPHFDIDAAMVLHVAARNGHHLVANTLMMRGALAVNIQDADSCAVLHHAALGDSDEPRVIASLIVGGADINIRTRRGETALHLAVREKHSSVTAELLSRGCHASLQDAEGDTAVHYAVRATNPSSSSRLLAMLLERKPDLLLTNKNGFNVFHLAALKGNVTALRLLLERVTEQPWVVNEAKEDGYTALHLAALNGHAEVADLLLKQPGIALDARNSSSQTALHLAVERQHHVVLQLLLKAGVDPNVQDKDGDSPLHEALRHYTIGQMRQLDDVKDVDKLLAGKALGISGAASHLKAPESSGSSAIARLLASHGADLTLRNKKDQTPADLCPDQQVNKALALSAREAVSTRKTSASCSRAKTPERGASSAEVARLQQELDQLKNQTSCPVCLDRIKNMVFSCGHSTCQFCGDQLTECPICRKEICDRILLY